MNYSFEDFTEKNYKKLLKIAKRNYQILTYDEALTNDSFILWRHDVDFSMHRALALAKIEKNEGVKATYFVQLGSIFYNLFEQEIKDRLIKIIDMGHDIGLHFDPKQYIITGSEDLKKWLLFEKETVENLFNINIGVFSFHMPDEKILKNDQLKLGGMINIYARYFREEVGYCSDSNGYWQFDPLEDVLKKKQNNKLQVLTHPCWWQKNAIAPQKRLRRCIYGRANNTEVWYTKTAEKYGRKIIDK